MFYKIILERNYPVWIKLSIDFSLLATTFFFISELIEMPVYYLVSISHLVYAFVVIVLFYIFKINKLMFRYFNIQDSIRLLLVLFLGSLIGLFYSYYTDQFLIINQILFFFISSTFLLTYRIIIKVIFSRNKNTPENLTNIIVYGAGKTGIFIKRALYNSSKYKVYGFIDDDKDKIEKSFDGVTVFKIGEKLDEFLIKKNISKIIFSTEKLTSNRKKFLYNYFKNLNIQLLELPPVDSWINGVPNISKLKPVNLNDLLGRGLIKIDNKKNKLFYNQKIILVSGAAGSIGSEIVRQIIKFKPSKIILLDNSETSMFKIKEELKSISEQIELLYYLNSVTDKIVVEKIFSLHKIDIVFHAAAYKHVNMMEENPRAAIINNVYGSKVVIDYSIKYNVNTFVLVSSDKAVNPTNVMGATKRICELYLASKNKDLNDNTKFITTRFGNVLGSNGSVVPIFEKQIESGGPITITHPDIVRYFMTIPEASQLVLEAGCMGNGGEVYVFDMGDPVKISDLAKNMIIQKGLKIGKDIKIEYVGLRPGEKLFEELLIDTEDLISTHNDLIFISKKENIDDYLLNLIEDLIHLARNSFDYMEVVGLMKKIVPEYISNNSEFQILDKNEKNSL
jgi:FlaA1/EpsC-like NDP-sugar epimerase